MSITQESQSATRHESNDHPWSSSKMEVYLRIRPMNKLEKSKRSKNCVRYHTLESDKGHDIVPRLTVDSPSDGEFDFSFDKIFKEDATQEQVYNSISSQAKNLIDGYNSAIITYGQSGSGKSHTMVGEDPLQDRHVNVAHGKANTNIDVAMKENTGVIPRIAKGIFECMGKTSPVVEFTVRVSYIEIYLEQIRDLLSPSTKFLKIYDREDRSDYERRKGPTLEGLSEVCCLEWTEVVALLYRGNSFRIVNGERKQTDLNQSDSIFTIKIEQRNKITGRTMSSKLHLVDLAGNEQNRQMIQRGKGITRSPSKSPIKAPINDRERYSVNQSHVALQNVLKVLENYHDRNNHGGQTPLLPPHTNDIPYHESKLTRILWNALGGNCHTTFILTASAASFNISATVSTLRFGQKCMQITNFPYLNIEASPEECNIELEKSKKIQSELLVLIKEIGTEMRRINDKETINTLQVEGPLWEKLNEICESNKYFVLEEQSTAGSQLLNMSLQDELRRKDEELKDLQSKLVDARNARDRAQTRMLEMEGECVFLRNESDEVLASKKRNTEDIIDAQNEIQRLSQKKLELEHELRVSKFRENEAINFTRLFRRFYRKLLQNNAALGSGSPNEIILKMAGVPDLDDLIDIDVLLCKSGLIEDHEVNSNMENADYNPSLKAIDRSSALASKANRQAKLLFSASRRSKSDVTNTTNASKHTISTSYSVDESMNDVFIVADGGDSTGGKNSVSIQEIKSLQSPAVSLAEKRSNQLERDLLRITRRCIDLQMALNESEEWVELLTASKPKKKILDENVKLKGELKKKESDMQAIIWKMNEIQTLNSTFNQKLAGREEYISYLEEQVAQLQEKDSTQTEKQGETEKKLQTEIMRLNSLLDSMARMHWQDGKKGDNKRLESRIIIPFQGGSLIDPSERESLLYQNVKVGSRPYSRLSDERTSAGISYAPSYGPSVASSVFVDEQMSINDSIKEDDYSLLSTPNRTASKQIDGKNIYVGDSKSSSSTESHGLFAGGKAAQYEPRRSNSNKNKKIMPATLNSSSSPIPFAVKQVAEDNSLTIGGIKLESKSKTADIKSDKPAIPRSLPGTPSSLPGTPSSLNSTSSSKIKRQRSFTDTKKIIDQLELEWKDISSP